tara:strand:- start:290 stop:487 length:198 start_codon:yes stop_codon:yes gene_type:complete
MEELELLIEQYEKRKETLSAIILEHQSSEYKEKIVGKKGVYNTVILELKQVLKDNKDKYLNLHKY